METTSIQQWRARGEVRPLKGHNIFVIDEGQASQPTVLLIHGFPTASWDWWQIWSVLRQHYRLIALDLLGFGFSDKPHHYPYSINEQADIVEALVGHKQLQSFDVVTHDYGNTVAQELLARQNSGNGVGQWRSLTLLNGGLFPETHRAVLAQKLLLSPLGALITHLVSKKKFADNLKHIFGPYTPPSQVDIDGFWDLLNVNQGRRNFHRLIRYMPERIEHRERWVGALQHAAMPIALINGSADPISGAHMVDRYLEVVGEPDYMARMNSIGHYPQVEDSEGVSTHILKFLASISA